LNLRKIKPEILNLGAEMTRHSRTGKWCTQFEFQEPCLL
jgi:hypothetical protein